VHNRERQSTAEQLHAPHIHIYTYDRIIPKVVGWFYTCVITIRLYMGRGSQLIVASKLIDFRLTIIAIILGYAGSSLIIN
jgi:hypothetical protein